MMIKKEQEDTDIGKAYTYTFKYNGYAIIDGILINNINKIYIYDNDIELWNDNIIVAEIPKDKVCKGIAMAYDENGRIYDNGMINKKAYMVFYER